MADRVYPTEEISSTPAKKEHEMFSQIPKDVVYKDALPLPRNHPSKRAARRSSPCCRCISWICYLLGAFLMLLGIAVVVIYFVLQPRVPHYSITDAQLSEFKVTADSSGRIHLSSNVLFIIRARNPNKKIGIYYDDIKVALFYDGTKIGKGSVNPFYQGHKNTTLLDLNSTGKNIPLAQNVATTLKAALSDESKIVLKARTAVSWRLKVGVLKSPHVKLQVICNMGMSSPSRAGGARLESHSCKVKL